MRKVVLVGGPGVDLLNPPERLADTAGLGFIRADDLFRDHAQLLAAKGWVEPYARAAESVLDELTTDIVADALAKAAGGWVLSGYPETTGQAECLAQRGHQPDMVIEPVLTEDEYDRVMRWHIDLDPRRARWLCGALRMHSSYQERVKPLRAYYQARGMLRTTSGFGDSREVAARLTAIVTGG
jgi:adenylate kinase family enzyme